MSSGSTTRRSSQPHYDMPQQSEYPDPEISQLRNSGWTLQPSDSNHLVSDRRVKSGELRAHPMFQTSISMSQNNSAEESGIYDSSDGSTSADQLSDASSDFREFQTGLAELKGDIRHLKASLNPIDSNAGLEALLVQLEADSQAEADHGRGREARRGRRRGAYLGPRKAAEPSGDIKLRLGKASEAFISQRYDEARAIIDEVVRINAETHEAWTLLASIFRETREMDKALMALMYAAHLRPKNVNGWLTCAQFALEETGERRSQYLSSAFFCYSSALRADTKNLDARFGKAAIHAEKGNLAGAIGDYKSILKLRPHDTRVLRLLAETYIDHDDAESAKELYKTSIAHFNALPAESGQHLTWSDIDTYVELYGYLKQYDEAIKQIGKLARWLLGRASEDFWDASIVDDREWDVDDERRVVTPGFVAGRFPPSAYGDGLPLELRVKLGLYRLQLGHLDEAMRHLRWIEIECDTENGLVLKYSHLYRHVADQLCEAGVTGKALTLYRLLREVPEVANQASLHAQFGKCCFKEDLNLEAEESLQLAILLDDDHIDARMTLARLYEKLNEPKQAFIYVNEVLALLRRQQCELAPRRKRRTPHTSVAPSRSHKRRRLADPARRLEEEKQREDQLRAHYSTIRRQRDRMRAGDNHATRVWMDAASDLVDNFRGFKPFYPWDKYAKFLGYAHNQRFQAQTPLDLDVTAMADRLSQSLRGSTGGDKADKKDTQIPTEYRGIPFDQWLDILLEYALCLAKNGNGPKAYEICGAAKDAVVFRDSREDMFLTHLCWCMCALFASDEETCVTTARYFTREHQFTTDSYRLFAAISRMCHSPVSWYSAGPTQKYMLRQIKAMDYALVDQDRRDKYFAEKGSYSAHDGEGNLMINTELDISLLMLYGHILFTSSSYTYALNYFFRAHSLDPENPAINLSIGLAYINHAIKRQADNRQYLMLCGLSFMFRYYHSRKTSPVVEERQEAHFNVARTYHLLGLTHLAIPFYAKVLNEVTGEVNVPNREDLVIEAAHNLQIMYIAAGHRELSETITTKWLLI